MERGGHAADAVRLKLLGPARLSASQRASQHGGHITEEAPNFTSPGYSDRTHWVSGIGQDVLPSGCLGASRLAALGDKGPDSGGQVQGQ